jgi:hypothetical protein
LYVLYGRYGILNWNLQLTKKILLQRAIEEGADFIETDILASKDGALICFHDVTLDEITDVAEHKEFANRRTTYEVEWSNVTGWFVGLHLTTNLGSFTHFVTIVICMSAT